MPEDKKKSAPTSESKSEVAKREEKILKFWRENKIFEKSLTKKSPNGDYIFYDGPPFATGLPHYGHILASAIKDAVPRFWTMRGYRVARRFGWDCHGLPIENIIEKKLNIASRQEIEAIGIDKFNQLASETALTYASEWKKTIERIGRWVDFDGSYKTMNNAYIESVWWAIAEINKKGLVYEGTRVLPYCPRCETPIAQSEIAMDQSYKLVTDQAVTVKFKLKEEKVYILAWTTTPWTLPGNVALAVGPEIGYVEIEHQGERLILAEARLAAFGLEGAKVLKKFNGQDLVGKEYGPLFEVLAVKTSPKKKWQILPANFVTTTDGTGVVHTAVIHGEDDYKLGVEYDLPLVPLIDARGHFNDQAPEFLRGIYHKQAEKLVIKDLAERGQLFRQEPYQHSYPHCYRCGTPIIYYALPAWFINIQKIKPRLLKLNQKVNWVPKHLKDGRFKNIVEGAPDWNISRNRYWASPLPIWKCGKCGQTKFVDSLKTLAALAIKSGNKYFVMRHGEGEHNVINTISARVGDKYALTERGKNQVRESAKELENQNITRIFASPFLRTKQSAEIVAGELGIPNDQIIFDECLGELKFGDFDGKKLADYLAYEAEHIFSYGDRIPGGESYLEAKRRFGDFFYKLENSLVSENILIVTHGICPEVLAAIVVGADQIESKRIIDTYQLAFAKPQLFNLLSLPLNNNYELDLHRPYIDRIKLKCECGGALARIPEVFDCWFESAAMPFAANHYPFENQKSLKNNYPADFVAEYIAQTRTWFYYMLVLGTILFEQEPFKNVVTTGTILAADGEKMSKSKGNFPDPWLVFNRYGVDALRFYLLSTPVMRAEDLNFSARGADEVSKKIITRLINVHSFYQLYQERLPIDSKDSTLISNHVLDRWISLRLQELIAAVTSGLEAYTLDEALRPIETFIDDLSTWYLRRSRDRLREAGSEGQIAVIVLKETLKTLAKVMAPFTPFIAEEIYLNLKSSDDPDSVHLAEWPEINSKPSDNQELITKMAEVRRLVSLGLEARTRAGIKVRQPLSSLTLRPGTIDLSPELLELVKDEVNVKSVIFKEGLTEATTLDLTITPALAVEGEIRELVRKLQDWRKEAGLAPATKVAILVSTDAAGREFIETHRSQLLKAASLKDIQFKLGAHDFRFELAP